MNIDFSVITIVYNNIQHIKETMDSIINQSYRQIEYILVDGDSTDGTREIIVECIASCAEITFTNIKKGYYYLEAIHKNHPTFTFKFLSEKDKGIYDAMNKGIALATKKWVNFMNCGDRFYSPTVLGKIAQERLEQYDVIYGNTDFVSNNNFTETIKPKKSKHKYHHHFTHQSSFIRTKIVKEFPYDTSFKIAGDTDFFTKIYNSGFLFHHVDITISSFDLNGISSKLSFQMFCECCKIGFKYNKLFPLYLTIKWICWTIPKRQIKKLLFS